MFEEKFFLGKLDNKQGGDSLEQIKNSEAEFSLEVRNAESAIREFIRLKPEEKVVLVKDSDSNEEILRILRAALEKIGSQYQEFTLIKKIQERELDEVSKNADLIISLSMADESEYFYDNDLLIKNKNRLWALLDADPEVFKDGGALTEKRADIEEKLNKMENILAKASGFKVISSYGTNLDIGLRKFGERRWYKDSGAIDQPGKWDNLPGGEIFTTPDERTVNGTLVLPALDSIITPAQGVDEYVRINISDGVITSIEGGKSAKKLRKQLEKDMKAEKKGGENPYDVLRIAEISFGANSKARSRALDPEKSFSRPGASTTEAEKRFGTIHLAFGDSRHGEEGAEGFEGVKIGSHYDFVIPRNGLTVEMFMDEKSFDQKKNGRKIIEEGSIRFFN